MWLGCGYLLLFGEAHLAVRMTAPHADPVILPVVALLNGLGLVFIHRLDLAATTTTDPTAPATQVASAAALHLLA